MIKGFISTQYINNAKKIFLVSFLFLGSFQTFSLKSQTVNEAQPSNTSELPNIVSGEILESIKGSTVNSSKSSGSTASLSFGSSTTFGTSASVNATSATKASSESIFKVGNSPSSACPSGGCIKSTIGGADGRVTAAVTNMKASNLSTLNDTTVDSLDNRYTDATADLSGIGADNQLTLDGSETIFKARAATVHSDANFDSISSNILSEDAQTSSGSASGFTSTNTNVDINVSDYVTSFQQAF
mgnify:CR=1 FL=1